MRYHDGPMSKRNPRSSHRRARPPGWSFFSSTVTSQPRCFKRRAEARPANPAPMITAFILIQVDPGGRGLADADAETRQFAFKLGSGEPPPYRSAAVNVGEAVPDE